MKKIMFNDRYGLTQAVLERKKTMTRRIVKGDYVAVIQLKYEGSFIGKTVEGDSVILPPPTYKIGDVVAIAQPYKNDDVLTYNAYNEDGTAREDGFQRHKEMLGSNGYRNKMFVKAEYMPHRIRITGIKVERLQDISDDDCLKEGVICGKFNDFPKPMYFPYTGCHDTEVTYTPQYAFRTLINRVSGPHTWDGNPWVIAYTFELVD